MSPNGVKGGGVIEGGGVITKKPLRKGGLIREGGT